MTGKPFFTKSDIQAFGCPDCPADITVVPSKSGFTGKRVPVVTVRHHDTCPWAARYVGVNGATITGTTGVILHHIDGPADTPPSTDTPDAA